MSKKATESLSETKKRKEAEGCEPTLKRRGKSSQALALVEEGIKIRRESAQTEERLREEELEERRLARESQRELLATQQAFAANMQAQQQQFMLQMQQQNIQFLATMTNVFKNTNNNENQ